MSWFTTLTSWRVHRDWLVIQILIQYMSQYAVDFALIYICWSHINRSIVNLNVIKIWLEFFTFLIQFNSR